jgi:uncharacterized Zn-finger protein
MATATELHPLDSLIAQEMAKQRAAARLLADRCEHGVYIPAADRETRKAPYCTGCYSAPPFEGRAVHVIKQRGGNKANPTRTDYGCPDCRETSYIEISDSEKECAHCGTVYGKHH